MDAFLLVGQSNMSGRGKLKFDQHLDKSTKSTKSTKTIINGHEILSFNYNNNNNCWINAKDPLHFDKPNKCGIGPGLSFAKLIAELDIIDKNRKIGLIPCAIGGTSIKQWLPSNNDEIGIFEETIQKTILALNTKFESSNNKDIELKGILWHQGESDCDSIDNANEYLSNAIILFQQFRKYLNNDNIAIICGGLGDFLGENIKQKNDNRFIYFNIINETLMNLPSRLHNFGYVSASNLNHNGDYLHFDGDSCKELGRRYAAKYAQLSGSLSNDELNKYLRFNKFKNALKKQSKKAYEKTKGISYSWLMIGIGITVISIFAYKRYTDK